MATRKQIVTQIEACLDQGPQCEATRKKLNDLIKAVYGNTLCDHVWDAFLDLAGYNTMGEGGNIQHP